MPFSFRPKTSELSLSIHRFQRAFCELNSSLNNLIVTEKFTFNVGSIGANSYKRLQVNISKNGYIPIGIIEISNTGTGDAWQNITEFYIENNVANITINNQLTASNYTLSGYIRVLYIKS